MAKGAWKMTAARKAYYASKKKSGGKKGRSKRGSTEFGREFGKLYKQNLHHQKLFREHMKKTTGASMPSRSSMKATSVRETMHDLTTKFGLTSKKSAVKFGKVAARLQKTLPKGIKIPTKKTYNLYPKKRKK